MLQRNSKVEDFERSQIASSHALLVPVEITQFIQQNKISYQKEKTEIYL